MAKFLGAIHALVGGVRSCFGATPWRCIGAKKSSPVCSSITLLVFWLTMRANCNFSVESRRELCCITSRFRSCLQVRVHKGCYVELPRGEKQFGHAPMACVPCRYGISQRGVARSNVMVRRSVCYYHQRQVSQHCGCASGSNVLHHSFNSALPHFGVKNVARFSGLKFDPFFGATATSFQQIAHRALQD